MHNYQGIMSILTLPANKEETEKMITSFHGIDPRKKYFTIGYTNLNLVYQIIHEKSRCILKDISQTLKA